MSYKSDFPKIEQRFKALQKRLPKIVGQHAVNFARDNFRRQGFLDRGRIQKWKKRRFQGKRSKGRGILVASGKLRRSIRIGLITKNSVVISSKTPYSKIHNEGGVVKQKVSPKQQAFFWARYKATGNEMWKRFALSKTIKANIPKRQFIGDSTDLRRELLRDLKLRLLKITK